MLIEMKVSSLTVDPFTNMPILLLEEPDGKRKVPIWIGLVEASAIATELEKIHLDRPMTHDLMKTVLTQYAIQVDRVEIHDLKDNTFYATLFLRQGGSKQAPLAVDARPSDAIALALRMRAPIFVATKVIERARRLSPRTDLGPDAPNLAAMSTAAMRAVDETGEFLEGLADHAFGKWKM